MNKKLSKIIKESLVNGFKKAEKHHLSYMLGLEVEHFVLHNDTLEAVSYYQDHGIEDILKKISNTYKYNTIFESGHVVGLENKKAAISIEPGGQVEISIKPQVTLAEVDNIYLSFLNEIVPLLEEWDMILVNIGYQPLTSIKDIPLLPKQRYDYMYDYLGKQGSYAHNMMKGTASIQVNIDYSNEKDYIKKNKVANYLSPLIYSVFDNSPLFEGEVCKKQSLRAVIWDNCDKKRCGFSPAPFSSDFGYEKYAEYILNTPPIFIKEEGKLVYTEDRLFEEIYDVDNYTEEGIEHLLTMVFPDVRTKQYIEIRMGDSLPYPYMMGYLALWKGLLYDQHNLDVLYEKAKEVDNEYMLDIKRRVKKNGKNTLFKGKPIMEYYRYILKLAQRGLSDKEKEYIEGIEELANKGIVPKEKALNYLEEDKKRALKWSCAELPGN
jgi:glutamate--cysteine ligase